LISIAPARQDPTKTGRIAAMSSSTRHNAGSLPPANVEHVIDPSTGRRYMKGRLLGKGGFAKCYECHCPDLGKGPFALKVVMKASIIKPRAQAKLRSEIAIHQALNHERVVKFLLSFEDTECHYMLLELCPNMTLNERLKRRKRMAEAEAAFYMRDLIEGVCHLHSRRVIHRDLKLGNLLLDKDNRIKIADFGLAAQLSTEDELRRTICGTPNYIAPEILDDRIGHSYAVDTWSIGVIMYTLLFGRPPFETSDVKATYRRIRSNQYAFPEGMQVSGPAKAMISSVLKTDPFQRPSLRDMLNDPWLGGGNRVPYSMQASPRCGSTERSATPERGLDYARIDSPAPTDARLSARDTSPAVFRRSPMAPVLQSHTPVLGSKPRPGDIRRTGSRPPLHSGRADENTAPTNAWGWADGNCPPQAIKKEGVDPNGPPPTDPLRSARGRPTTLASPRPGSARGGRGPPLAMPSSRAASPVAHVERLRSPSQSGTLPGVQSQMTQGPRGRSVERLDRNTATACSTPLQSSRGISADGPVPPPSPMIILAALEGNGDGRVSARGRARIDPNSMPEIWALKWVDYTSKYGVGYTLSDGSTGVFFNDSTKIITSPGADTFTYIERKETDRTVQQFADYPEAMRKKVLLLKHFQSYLEHPKERKVESMYGESSMPNNGGWRSAGNEVIHAKKVLRTKHAVLFQMSNRLVQVAFFDKSELVISSRAGLVVFIDKRGEKTTYPLEAASTVVDPDFTKRMNYAKEVLRHMSGRPQETDDRRA